MYCNVTVTVAPVRPRVSAVILFGTNCTAKRGECFEGVAMDAQKEFFRVSELGMSL
jgi:hypothetical protein